VIEALVEGVVTLAAIAVYGTDTNPRHPALRNGLRLIAFGGLTVALAWVSFWPNVAAPMYVTAPWMLAGLIVLLAEYDLGSKRLACLGVAGLALLIVVALLQMLR
jgi:hypothetical protein